MLQEKYAKDDDLPYDYRSVKNKTIDKQLLHSLIKERDVTELDQNFSSCMSILSPNVQNTSYLPTINGIPESSKSQSSCDSNNHCTDSLTSDSFKSSTKKMPFLPNLRSIQNLEDCNLQPMFSPQQKTLKSPLLTQDSVIFSKEIYSALHTPVSISMISPLPGQYRSTIDDDFKETENFMLDPVFDPYEQPETNQINFNDSRLEENIPKYVDLATLELHPDDELKPVKNVKEFHGSLGPFTLLHKDMINDNPLKDSYIFDDSLTKKSDDSGRILEGQSNNMENTRSKQNTIFEFIIGCKNLSIAVFSHLSWFSKSVAFSLQCVLVGNVYFLPIIYLLPLGLALLPSLLYLLHQYVSSLPVSTETSSHQLQVKYSSQQTRSSSNNTKMMNTNYEVIDSVLTRIGEGFLTALFTYGLYLSCALGLLLYFKDSILTDLFTNKHITIMPLVIALFALCPVLVSIEEFCKCYLISHVEEDVFLRSKSPKTSSSLTSSLQSTGYDTSEKLLHPDVLIQQLIKEKELNRSEKLQDFSIDFEPSLAKSIEKNPREMNLQEIHSQAWHQNKSSKAAHQNSRKFSPKKSRRSVISSDYSNESKRKNTTKSLNVSREAIFTSICCFISGKALCIILSIIIFVRYHTAVLPQLFPQTLQATEQGLQLTNATATPSNTPAVLAFLSTFLTQDSILLVTCLSSILLLALCAPLHLLTSYTTYLALLLRDYCNMPQYTDYSKLLYIPVLLQSLQSLNIICIITGVYGDILSPISLFLLLLVPNILVLSSFVTIYLREKILIQKKPEFQSYFTFETNINALENVQSITNDLRLSSETEDMHPSKRKPAKQPHYSTDLSIYSTRNQGCSTMENDYPTLAPRKFFNSTESSLPVLHNTVKREKATSGNKLVANAKHSNFLSHDLSMNERVDRYNRYFYGEPDLVTSNANTPQNSCQLETEEVYQPLNMLFSPSDKRKVQKMGENFFPKVESPLSLLAKSRLTNLIQETKEEIRKQELDKNNRDYYRASSENLSQLDDKAISPSIYGDSGPKNSSFYSRASAFFRGAKNNLEGFAPYDASKENPQSYIKRVADYKERLSH